MLAKDNSPSTRGVFGSKHCQGGGVTWAAILDALVRRRGTSKAVEDVNDGVTAIVATLRQVSQAAQTITKIALQTRLVAFNAGPAR